jgi:hypothetical protein
MVSLEIDYIYFLLLEDLKSKPKYLSFLWKR